MVYKNLRIKNVGFTLAEVLITLGVIGVVAAMTIPTMMTNYAKHRTETKLVKFYSTINQALRLSVAENGTPEGWIISGKTYSYAENVEFLKTYISPYLKHGAYRDCTYAGQIGVCMALFDGGDLWFSIDSQGGDISYIICGIDKLNKDNVTHNMFRFQFSKVSGLGDNVTNSTDFIEPYVYGWDKQREHLIGSQHGCQKGTLQSWYCSKLIEQNGWKIPGDYPW